MSRHGSVILRCASLALVLLVPALDAAEWDPVSRLSRPPRGGTMYITVAGGGGSVADGDQLRPGYSLAAILRPHRAEDFLRGLYARNTAFVFQIDKQGGGPAKILSGDLVLRHYLADMRPQNGGRATFLGLGAGISHASWRRTDDEGYHVSGSADAFTFLVEAGLEWNLDPALVLVGKGQYRLYDRGGHDLSGWSVHIGVGFAAPF